MSLVEDVQPVELAPESWLSPAGRPDPLMRGKHGLIGAPISRLDGPLKVQGKATFAAEFPVDRMAYAALAFSSIAKGRIATLDAAEAEAAPGVVLVMTHHNAPRMQPMPMILTGPKALGGDNLPILQDDRIHWNGQPIAVVLAETQEQADYAASLIRTTYASEPAITEFSKAVEAGVEQGQFFGHPLNVEIGDAEHALAAAAVMVDETYSTPRHTHNAIEPHAATLAWQGDALVVHDSSQAVSHAAWSLAQVFGLDETQVHVTSPYVGGGFGSKTFWQHQVLGAAAAKLAGRPVRMTLSREGVYRLVGGRSLTQQRVAIGASMDGRFEAIVHTGTSAMTGHNALPEAFILQTQTLYRADSFKLNVDVVRLDTLANTFMRAPGEAVGTFALECAIDELAVKLGMDPIDLRVRNEPDHDPLHGKPFSSRHLVEAWRAGAERFGWSARNPTPGAVRDGEWWVGVGCATSTYPYNRFPGGAARITLTRDGCARIEIAAHEMGMGTSTAQTQVAAARLGLGMDQVTFAYADSSLPGTVMAGGSQQTAAVGAAVAAAQRTLVATLLQLAGNDSPLAGLSPDEVGGLNGGLACLDDPSRWESYAAILARAQRDEVTADAMAPPPGEAQQWSMHSYGAMFCEVRVSAVTGEVRVSRFLGSFDCGRILNAKTAASQLKGGVIMGLGLALMEETQFDERSGRIMNPSLAEYHMPVHMDVPDIDVIWTDIPDPHAPMGARGIGEIGITGVGAAVANAIFNATGKRIRDLPLTLEKLI
jgi:xanthine dehydrogenase YagR molybdenum-binding subunit